MGLQEAFSKCAESAGESGIFGKFARSWREACGGCARIARYVCGNFAGPGSFREAYGESAESARGRAESSGGFEVSGEFAGSSRKVRVDSAGGSRISRKRDVGIREARGERSESADVVGDLLEVSGNLPGGLREGFGGGLGGRESPEIQLGVRGACAGSSGGSGVVWIMRGDRWKRAGSSEGSWAFGRFWEFRGKCAGSVRSLRAVRKSPGSRREDPGSFAGSSGGRGSSESLRAPSGKRAVSQGRSGVFWRLPGGMRRVVG